MRLAPRGILLLALAVAATGFRTEAGRAVEDIEALDYATVGRVVARLVDGRTVVVVPVAGTLRPKLSEPIRKGNRWRLDLIIEDARLSIGAPVRRPEGLAALTVEEVGSDVRVTVEVNELGDYGARRSEEGMLLWIDPERRVRAVAVPAGAPTSMPLTGSPPVAPEPRSRQPTRAQSAPVGRERTNWVGLIGLVVAAAGAGAAVRHVRREGWPAWAEEIRSNGLRGLRSAPGRPADQPAQAVEEEQGADEPRVPFGKTPVDPRGRSAEIGDAFRVQPERPASGIAALVATNENDAE